MKVYGKEVKEGFDTPCFFTEILDRGGKPETKNFSTGGFTLKILYFQEVKNELDQLEKVDEIKELFGMVFIVDSRKLTIKEYSHDFIGEYSDILQISVDFDWKENTRQKEMQPLAESMKITWYQKGENGMGAPSINISFIEKAVSAITRGERGIVLLWVKDPLPESAVNPITVVTEKDIPKDFSEETKEQIELAMIGYINSPKKVLVYCMGIKDESEIKEKYDEAMEKSETLRFDYLAIPTVEADGKTQIVAAWIKTMRTVKRKKVKAVLPRTSADQEGIINYTTNENIKTKLQTDNGITTETRVTYTAEQYCSRIAGLIAGTPITISCTYAPLPELTECTKLQDIDTPVDKGEFILFHDGEKVKVVRGVNSFVTTVDGKGGSFKKIKIVDAMDMINDDIVKTAQDSYLGKYANSYSNKCLLLSGINSYFMQLKKDDIVSSYSISLDADAIREYLKGMGIKAVLPDETVKEVDDCSDDEIITVDTGAKVFLKGTVKILDAIEDIDMRIFI